MIRRPPAVLSLVACALLLTLAAAGCTPASTADRTGNTAPGAPEVEPARSPPSISLHGTTSPAPAEKPKMFTARGLIEVEPVWQVPAGDLRGVAPATIQPEYYSLYINSTVLSVKRTRVLQAALDTLRDEQKLYVGVGAAAHLANDLRVEHLPGTMDIVVSLSGPDKVAVQALVREVLSRFVMQLKDDRDQADMARQKGLWDEQKDLRKQVDRLAADLSRYRDETSLIITDEHASEQMERVKRLTSQLSDTQTALAAASAEWNRLQEFRKKIEDKDDSTVLVMAFPELGEAVRTDPRVVATQQEIDRREIDTAIANAAGKAADAASTEKIVTALRKILEKRQAEALGAAMQNLAARLRNQFDRLREVEAELLKQVAEARIAAIDAAKRIGDYQMREAEYRRVLAILNTVTGALERMRIEASITRPTVRVASYPDIPIEPDGPTPAASSAEVPAKAGLPAEASAKAGAATDAQSLYKQAQELMKADERAKAYIAIFQALKAGGEQDADMQFLAARICMHQSPPAVQKAIEALKTALTINPKHVEAQRMLAELYTAVRWWQEAKIECDKLIALAPSDARGYLWAAVAEMRLGDAASADDLRKPFYEAAAAKCRAGIASVPNTPDLYRVMAQAYEKLGQNEKIDAILDQAITNNPAVLEFRIQKAGRLLDAKKTAEAEKVIEEIAKIGRESGRNIVELKNLETRLKTLQEESRKTTHGITTIYHTGT
jgi:tetratricopeptide (TPR) repeat protein